MLKTCIGQSVCESVFQSVPRFSHVQEQAMRNEITEGSDTSEISYASLKSAEISVYDFRNQRSHLAILKSVLGLDITTEIKKSHQFSLKSLKFMKSETKSVGVLHFIM